MFARVLFPTDLSAYADCVLACLPDLKSAGLREVVLLSVIRPSDVPLPETLNRDSLEYWRWMIDEKLNIAKMALEGKGLQVWTRIEYGNPVEQIVRVAEDERVALIVLGAQGMTAAQELLIGSTAYEVMRRATAPVFLQKVEVVRELGHMTCQQVCAHAFERVLHPTDFSECADAAFQVVKRLKAAGTNEVIVLHVQDERVMKLRSPEQLAQFDRRDTERLEALCKSLSMFGLQSRPILRHGIPFKEVLAVADEMDVSLIVLGSQGRSAVREILAGSTFENVARLSRQPVLVVRSRQEAMR
ncbi:MAG: universal stress protein [Anaerolineales bacterium]